MASLRAWSIKRRHSPFFWYAGSTAIGPSVRTSRTRAPGNAPCSPERIRSKTPREQPFPSPHNPPTSLISAQYPYAQLLLYLYPPLFSGLEPDIPRHRSASATPKRKSRWPSWFPSPASAWKQSRGWESPSPRKPTNKVPR